jgi:hypothetical protein
VTTAYCSILHTHTLVSSHVITAVDFQVNTCGHSPYVTSSLTRGWVCRLQLLLALASAIILRPEFGGTHNHILLSQIRDSHNLEGQVPVFISPRKRVGPLYPQALGSIFVSSNDSQGYGGGIRNLLNTGSCSSLYNLGTDCTGNAASDNSSTASCVSVATIT